MHSSEFRPGQCAGEGVTRQGPEKQAGRQHGQQEGQHEARQSDGRHRLQSSYRL